MMTPRDVVRAAVAFERHDRLPRSFPEPYGNDFCGAGMNPSPDARPNGNGVDEWGAVWHKWYGDPEGAGHSRKAIEAMCSEFLKIGG